MPQAVFDYHYGMESEQYAFLRIPKVLITDPYFKALSTDAKLLYGLMLDRMSLSVKNGWLDEDKRVYIYFTLTDICEQLCCKTDKAVKLMAELDSAKGIGLIERVKQGQGRPARIYVKRFVYDTSEIQESDFGESRSADYGKTEVKSSENQKSRLRKNRSADYGNSESNNTELNNTDFSYTDLSIHQSGQMDMIDGYREQVKENISYEFLVLGYPNDEIQEITELITETLCT
ncbi:MAG: replication initiator protein A, partial [Firmicutes bacterium]|nr:replication initiator protein A [Bacillota bacterium]